MEEAGADGAAEPPPEEEEDSSGITGFSGSTGRGIETCLVSPLASVAVTFAPGSSLSLMVSSSSSLPARERALPLGLPALAVSSRLPDRSMSLLMMPLLMMPLSPLPLPPAALTVPPEMATRPEPMMPLPPPLPPLPPLAVTVPPEMVTPLLVMPSPPLL